MIAVRIEDSAGIGPIRGGATYGAALDLQWSSKPAQFAPGYRSAIPFARLSEWLPIDPEAIESLDEEGYRLAVYLAPQQAGAEVLVTGRPICTISLYSLLQEKA